MSNARHHGIALTALLLTACTNAIHGPSPTASLESELRRGYTRKVDSLYVVIATNEPKTNAFVYDLSQVLGPKLDLYHVAADVRLADPLAIGVRSPGAADSTALRAPFLLKITLRTMYTIGSKPSGALFALELFERGDKGPVWIALLTTSDVVTTKETCPAMPAIEWTKCNSTAVTHSFGFGVGDAVQAADVIVGYLAGDGLLPSH